MDLAEREFGLGKGRSSMDWVKGYCGLGRAGVWIG